MVDQDAAEKIQGLHRQLQEGADFEELVKEHSEDNKSGWGVVALSELTGGSGQ